MFGGLDPKKMQGLMKQMGIKQEEVDAERVIIEGKEKRIIIEPTNVVKMTMQGQANYQVTGEVREETLEVKISEEDIKMVMEKTGASREKAGKALEETGDIAEAIIKLS
ncbi:nascent polypeptide-associated complex protein [Candidatus Pacearchaeota archaeon]|nr:nascent polypeptide-associated complex protein [Candidatus Pacearchaeota archaeon]